ncbi:amino acid adenylation domain-containing protein [Agrobacterium leguminum]|uniref:non-ribosomal peptide synthetase n=1 Tax=Agrobacterium leguminum TaxID=2792015 RepID=UPI002444C967|nr:non-ribosomal peptide synthetase [Agrobacterium leguminum]WFS69318.1 amino acid adenylation domain-containing protein [Agrobacterium leguminum]
MHFTSDEDAGKSYNVNFSSLINASKGEDSVKRFINNHVTCFTLDKQRTQQLHDVASSMQVCKGTILFVAFQYVLGRWFERDDFIASIEYSEEEIARAESVAVNSSWSNDYSLRSLLEPAGRGASISGMSSPPATTETAEAIHSTGTGIRLVLYASVEQPHDSSCPRKDEIGLAWRVRSDEHHELLFSYPDHAFSQDRASHLLLRIADFLSSASQSPDAPINQLHLFELRKTKAWASDAPIDSPIAAATSIIDRFCQIATDHSQASALVGPNSVWSYATLLGEAEHIAFLIAELRLESPQPIGIMFDPEPVMIAAVLGVLGAGHFYVPISPSDPRPRIEAIARESGCQHILTKGDLVGFLASLSSDIKVVDVASAPTHRQQFIERRDTSYAYILHTSGSTGIPKGVLQNDGNILEHIAVYSNALDIQPADRIALLPAITSDAAVKVIFGALLNGASLCLWDLKNQGLVGLDTWLDRNQVTIWHSTPTLLRAAMSEFERPLNLRWVVLGGERVAVEDVRDLRDFAGSECRMMVGYSQTECSTVLECFPLDNGQHGGQALTAQTVAGLDILLLDNNRMPTPFRGEIAVDTTRLAVGYWRRPELTAERFVPNPVRTGHRLYLTGDVGEWTADGRIEVLGRIDDQIKLRGYRVELKEIEHAILKHPAAARCVTIVSRGDPEELTCFVVLRKNTEQVDGAAFRDFLQSRLPDHMVPNRCVVLSAFPLLSNGKIDRLALENMDVGNRDDCLSSPSADEALLVQIWSELLKVRNVEVTDNFFELGGHSLLAMQMIARIRSQLGFNLSLRTVLKTPTVRALAAAIGAASAGSTEDKIALVQFPRLGPVKASFAQEGLAFLDRMESVGAAYNIPVAFDLLGALSIATLERSFEELIRRHEVLRTRFAVEDGQTIQVIDRPSRFRLDVRDVHGQPDGLISELVRAEALEPFDLEKGPLLRASLLRIAADQHILLVTMHHIICDGWSIRGILPHELGTLYTAFSLNQPSPLPALPVQYADYAVWQREWLQGEVLEHQLAYWRQQLAGLPAALALPTDRRRPVVSSFRGERVPVIISEELGARLLELGRRHGATPYMVLLAAFQLLLSRWSGQFDIVVGSPIAGRTQQQVEGLMGLFVNTLVLRTDLSDDPSFLQLLERVKETALAAYAHQDIPFEKLVAELQIERDLSRHPLFQVMFALQNVPHAILDLPGLQLTPVERPHGTSKFDLFLQLTEREGGFAGSIEFAADLFERSTIERLRTYFLTLLEGIVDIPDQPVSEVTLLSPAERQLLLVEWNDTQINYPTDKCAHELFTARALQEPDAIAVVYQGKRLTYAELNRRANQVAHHLQSLGAKPESIVGLCVDRSDELIVSVLGILKAGAAYLPLDPSYPHSRLSYMLENSGASILLTQSHIDFAPTQPMPVLRLDSDRTALDQQPDTAPETGVRPENLAYVIYTSGSTGRPKGVAAAHSSVANRVFAQAQFNPYGQEDICCHKGALGFVDTFFEILVPLVYGRPLVVFHKSIVQNPEELVLEIRRCNITRIVTVPSLAASMLEVRDVGQKLANVVNWTLSGERLRPDLFANLSAALPWCRIVNLYGSTELAADATVELDIAINVSSIGRALPNNYVYVLDKNMQPVPIGASGELYVGGAGLARGYINEPGLTAEAFVPDPFGYGTRLFRTKDIVCWRPDGSIEFIGRADDQIKVRGHRVEPGEIEAALLAYPEVKDAAVILQQPTTGDARLTAFVVASDGLSINSVLLKASLRQTLPEFLIPAELIAIDALPRGLTGKIDRLALSDRRTSTLIATASAPLTPTEEVLISIWRHILAVETVDPEDNFFALGGHSLLATRVMARVRDYFDLDLPVRMLFEDTSTLKELAKNIDRARQEKQGILLHLSKRSDSGKPERLSHSQERLLFLSQLYSHSVAYNEAMAFDLLGALSIATLERSFEELIRRHEVLRTRFAVEDGQTIQVIDRPSRFRLDVRDVHGQPDGLISELVRAEALEPFDLEKGPLLRASLLRIAADQHILLVTMHHIICDGWSIRGILPHELGTLYTAFSLNQPSPLPALPVQYADYAVWQREWLQGEVLEHQLAYWRQQLAGLPAALALPTDRRRPVVSSFRGERVPVIISEELGARLLELGRRHGATPYMVLLAAFQLLLSRWSGQFDIVVGSPIAGRTQQQVEGLMGLFVNTLVLRTDLSDDPSFLQLLERVKETALAAYAHQDIPFEKLVAELQIERDLSRHPLFQVMFALQNVPHAILDLPGLQLTPVERPHGTSKFDLFLQLTEREGGFAGSIEFAADLFERSTIERLRTYFLTLLEGIVDIPDQPVSEVTLLSPAERQLLLVEWNDTQINYPTDKCAHELFTARALQEPDAIAVVYQGKRLTYAELNRRANQVAHHLQSLGAKPESIVGLCVDRSDELIVSVLGILKAGAAYLPLDPSYPHSRLSYMLENSGASILLTQSHIDFAPTQPMPVLRLDSDRTALDQQPDTAPETGVRPENLAYVIYTSGSTGRPKGVMIEHRSLTNFVYAMMQNLKIDSSSVVAALTNLSFDISGLEIYLPLLTGAHLVMMKHNPDAEQLARELSDAEVTIIQATPSVWRLLLDSGWRPAPGLTILSGGEALPSELANFLVNRPGDTWNLYGPTETTVWSTMMMLHAGDAVAIGRPIANTRCYVVDSQMNLVPPGTPGELLIGGSGVARGYCNDPRLTAQRFSMDPFNHGGRLYRTGDIVSWNSDGTLRYIRRVDDQIKLRGHRIELGEVEAALLACQGVLQAAVVGQDNGMGDNRLIGFIVAAETDSAGLKEELRDSLPDHMIPSQIVFVNSLPMTPHGKLDRERLIKMAPRPSITERVKPHHQTAQTVAEVWRGILGVDEINSDDSFFDLGGHSLLVMKTVASLRHHLKTNLTALDFFKFPTVAALASFIDGETFEEDTSGDSDARARRARHIRRNRNSARATPSSSN